jgi:hypothetical protein
MEIAGAKNSLIQLEKIIYIEYRESVININNIGETPRWLFGMTRFVCGLGGKKWRFA